MQAVTEWILSNLTWLLPAVIILAFVFSVMRMSGSGTKLPAGKRAHTVQTLAFIRSIEQTGIFINDHPKLQLELDAIAEDGSAFQTSLRKVIPMTMLSLLKPGVAVPIVYCPDSPGAAVWDDSPDEALMKERAARYQYRRHPDDLTYDQRMELAHDGVTKKALLKSFRLTGREEAGDWEAEAEVQLAEDVPDGPVLERRLYVTDEALEFLIPGRYVDVRVVPGREGLFAFIQDASVIARLSR